MASEQFKTLYWRNAILGGILVALSAAYVVGDAVYDWDFSYKFENGASLPLDLTIFTALGLIGGIMIFGPFLNRASTEMVNRG